MGERIEVTTTDGVSLEADRSVTPEPRAGVVICHPNPTMGGDMYTPVPSALFAALDGLGCSGIRFNFRGVGRSGGAHDGGDAERLDVRAAIDAVVEFAPGVPVVVAGWSFGADVALATDDDRIGGWFLAAAPLVVHPPEGMFASRSGAPKRFLVPEVDQFAPPEVVDERTEGWPATSSVVVPGADHFFGGLMAPVVSAFGEFLDDLLG